MKRLLAFLLLLPALAAAPTEERIDLGSGRSAGLSLPQSWERAKLPPLPAEMLVTDETVCYSPKDSANEAVLITLLVARDERMADPEALLKLAKMASNRFARRSVEEKADFKEFKVAGRAGYAAVFTDPNLVGRPSEPGNYKTLTSCFVYLGGHVVLMASIFSDDPNGESYATARQIIQSVTLSPPQDKI